jgi:hypothetical protein
MSFLISFLQFYLSLGASNSLTWTHEMRITSWLFYHCATAAGRNHLFELNVVTCISRFYIYIFIYLPVPSTAGLEPIKCRSQVGFLPLRYCCQQKSSIWTKCGYKYFHISHLHFYLTPCAINCWTWTHEMRITSLFFYHCATSIGWSHKFGFNMATCLL